MTITGEAKTKAVLTRYPVTSGLTAETTRTYDRVMNLVPTQGSNVNRNMKKGLE